MNLAEELLNEVLPKSAKSPYTYFWSAKGLTLKKDGKVIAILDPFDASRLKSFVMKFVTT